MLGLVLLESFDVVHAQKDWELFGKVNGMVGDEVISMDLSGEVLWVASTYIEPGVSEAPLEGGVSLLDPATGNFSTYTPEEGLAHVKAWETLIDGKKVWFGTPRGLSMLDTTKLGDLGPLEINKAWTTYTTKDGLVEDDVKCLAKSGDLLWFGTFKSIGSLNTATGELSTFGTNDGLPFKGAQSIAIDGKYVWIGTTSGLARFDTDKGEFKSFTIVSDSLETNIINVVTIDDESVWVGTREGIFILDKTTEEWTSLEKEDLADVQDIVISEKEVWVATRKGVAILNRAKDKWKIIDEKKGLASNDVRAIKLTDEYIWIGTAKGLNKYYPGAAAAKLRQIILIVVVLAAVGAGAVVAKVKFFKPSPEELEKKRKDEEIRAKRKERRKTGKPSWQLCGGTPQKELCGRCKYNSVKSGKLHCSKYDIDLE